MIRNSFRLVFLNTLLVKALPTACQGLKDLIRNTCRLVGHGANSLKTSLILRTEHVKRKAVVWTIISCELSYFSNSVLFAFNDFPVRETERRRLAKFSCAGNVCECRNDGTDDFSTSERVFNNNETHSKAVVNRTTNDVFHDSSFRIKVAGFKIAKHWR